MKQIHKIVLTGGPCAGKSTSLSRIQTEFTEMGYKVFLVSETATSLITGGAFPDGTNILNPSFQKALIQKQINEETMYFNLANDSNYEKVLIVCDRGAMDGKAYCSEEDFANLLKSVNVNEVKLRDSYDGIFHLRTSAYGAEAFYSLENNLARTESVEEARMLDDAVIHAWTGHPHLRVIDNSTNFETKIKKLLKEILSLLGEPIPYEIERKFVIKLPSEDVLKQLKAQKIEILQTYILSESGYEERVRQRGIDGNYIFFHTIKKRISDEVRVETERKITKTEYLNYLMFSDTRKRQIRKDRWCFIFNNQYFELDVFQNEKEYSLLEIELNEENQPFEIPELLIIDGVCTEVTSINEFKNDSLANEENIHEVFKNLFM